MSAPGRKSKDGVKNPAASFSFDSSSALFHQFKLESDGSSDIEESVRLRKRQRQVLSCKQCHQSKVKCNRELPCDRCKTTGKSDQCSYEYRSRSPSKLTVITSDVSDRSQSNQEAERLLRTEYYSNDLVSNAGMTNWTRVLSEFHEARDFVFGRDEHFADTYRRLMQIKELFPRLNVDKFATPLSSPQLNMRSTSSLLQSLPPTQVVHQLIDNYMDTFNVTHRIYHRPQFERDLKTFCQTPDIATFSWIAQLFSMLSLSCISAPEDTLKTLEPAQRYELSSRYLYLSELALSSSTVMTYPDLPSICALCMTTISKSLQPDLPYSASGVVGLTAFLIRVAMSISLHRDPVHFHDMGALEKELRRRVWNLTVYLDLNTAMDCGTPPVLRPGDWNTAAPAKMNDDDLERVLQAQSLDTSERDVNFDLNDYQVTASTHEAQCTDGALQTELSESFETISSIISNLNSARVLSDYVKVLEWDLKLKSILWKAQQTFDVVSTEPTSSITKSRLSALLQYTLLEVFLRRSLLALHQPFARQSTLSTDLETSHWSFLECSLAMMSAQQRLHDFIIDTARIGWFHNLVQPDFAVAMLHTLVSLRRRAFSDNDVTDVTSRRPARETTLAALKTSLAIVKTQASWSFHNLKVCFGLSVCMAVLEAIDAQTSPLDAAKVVVEELIDMVRDLRAPVEK